MSDDKLIGVFSQKIKAGGSNSPLPPAHVHLDNIYIVPRF